MFIIEKEIVILGASKGYSSGKSINNSNSWPSYGESLGDLIIVLHLQKQSSLFSLVI